MARVWTVHGPNEPAKNMPAFEQFLREKLASATVELAHHWHVQSPGIAIGRPIDAPLTAHWIIETHRYRLNTACPTIHRELVHVAKAAENVPNPTGAFKFFPFCAPFKPLLQSPVLDVPTANEEIEICPPIVVRLVSHRLLLLFKLIQ